MSLSRFHPILGDVPDRVIEIELIPDGIANFAAAGRRQYQKFECQPRRWPAVSAWLLEHGNKIRKLPPWESGVMLLLAMTGAEMIGDADAGRSLLARATKNCRLENSLNALEDTLRRLGFAQTKSACRASST